MTDARSCSVSTLRTNLYYICKVLLDIQAPLAGGVYRADRPAICHGYRSYFADSLSCVVPRAGKLSSDV